LLNEEWDGLQAAFARFIEALDTRIERLVAQDAELARRCARLRTIPGMGVQTAALLAALPGRIGFANAKPWSSSVAWIRCQTTRAPAWQATVNAGWRCAKPAVSPRGDADPRRQAAAHRFRALAQ